MTIKEYLEKKQVTKKELDDNFELERTITVDYISHKGCLNCEDKLNQQRLPHGSWTDAQHCWHCKRINFVYVSDRMGGSNLDDVFIYKEKN